MVTHARPHPTRAGRTALAAALSLLALGLAPAAAPAASTLDQAQTSSNASFGVSAQQRVAQSFTAGLDGRLDRVDLLLDHSGDEGPLDALLEVRAGSPAGEVLATEVIAASQVGVEQGWVSVAIAPAPRVSSGEGYAITLALPESECVGHDGVPCHTYAWRSWVGDAYTRGTAWVEAGASPFLPVEDEDLGFRTYVDPSPTVAEVRERTLGDVRGSDAYQALPAAAQQAAERQVARAVRPLEQITPELAPAERDRLLAAFAEGLTPLVARGLLTGEQAAELQALAGEL